MAEETKTEETKTEEKKQPSFEELINTWLSEDDAKRQLADIEIQRNQIRRDVAALNARLSELDIVVSIIKRQTCNKQPEA